MKEIVGKLDGTGLRIGIVISRFNSAITKELLAGALDCFQRHNVNDHDITTVWVPGSYELAITAQTLAQTKQFDALLCIGVVIKGATPHFDCVISQATSGISQAGMQSGVPVLFGVITTNTIEQAVERAGTKHGNKGFDTAMAAIEMATLFKALKASFPTSGLSSAYGVHGSEIALNRPTAAL